MSSGVEKRGWMKGGAQNVAGAAQILGFQKIKENDHLPGREQAMGEETQPVGL